ncbi:hypothetical protein TBR22_A30830 [Luteitalea sp. TBR-22]|uniref:hypothetical protein n=1 Tax=Luteitalea sp. TBR-22 TaxID=2802971 RepID=UPI001AFAAD9D|nr:hypothetical protein [Luteitalea sp. TBR-22]BCS33855.1 hypothetical protein TBR22_A30830 [Luteitalea sp. TBR-22]
MRLSRYLSQRGRARTTRAAALGLLLAATALAGGCSSTVTTGQGSSYLVIQRLEGASGAESGTYTSVLRSDVLTKGSIFEDNGRVTMSLAMKDVATGPTTNNLITLNRYRVEFRRTDGRNTPGEDVPYAFEGAITGTIGESASSIGFSLVRAQAKLEKPLVTLVGIRGGALIISTIADVTFFGKDQTGRDATVTGSISVNFADWADPE